LVAKQRQGTVFDAPVSDVRSAQGRYSSGIWQRPLFEAAGVEAMRNASRPVRRLPRSRSVLTSVFLTAVGLGAGALLMATATVTAWSNGGNTNTMAAPIVGTYNDSAFGGRLTGGPPASQPARPELLLLR
jgi:hypothetical protein